MSAGTQPSAEPAARSGGQILVDELRRHGCEVIFGVPGESYLAALDALCDAPTPRFVNARHEAGAANMAEAYGKLTGEPGVCFVTRGPGATHGSVGVHTAFQNSTPMVFLVGQVPRGELGREALQEVDHRAMLAPIAKWAADVMDPARIPELVQRAFTLATSGRRGPVVLVFPEDVLREVANAPEVARYTPVAPRPATAELTAVRERLARAERPLMLIGGGGWSTAAARAARSFAEASQLPVAVSFRCQDYLDNRSPSYVGHLTTMTDPALGRRVGDADVLLVVGDRLGDVTTGGYRWVAPPSPRQALIHVYPDAGELGRVFTPELAVLAGSEAFLSELEPVDGTSWSAHTEEARREYLDWSRPAAAVGELDLGAVIGHCARRLAGEAIITGDAGNFSIWVSRHLPFHSYGTQLMPQSGAMGYAIPAAVAAKLRQPDRTVVCFVGDGGFQMCGLELATAAQEGLAIVVIVVSNGMYGTIRAFQEREYPGRVIATGLANPDIPALARACGAAHAEAVQRTAEFPEAFERALAADGPALLDLRVDPQEIAPGETIAGLRAAATGAR